MARKGQVFTDWCKNKGYESVLNCFVEDISENITISDEKTVLTFKCEKCQQTATSTPKTIRDNIEKDNGKLIYKNCHRNTKIIKGGKTVQDWLNQNENIEFIGEVIEDNINKEINPSTISINSNKKIAIRCKIHDYIQRSKVQNLCTDNNKLMDCCKAKFLFQDWCLLFYRYEFNANVEVKFKENGQEGSMFEVKSYTGKLANDILECEDKSSVLINSSKLSTFKCPLKGDDYKDFEAIISSVCRGKAWCRSLCDGCDEITKNSALKTERITDVNEFLKVYYTDEIKKEVAEIKKKNDEKLKLYKSLPNEGTSLENTINYILQIDRSLQDDIKNILVTSYDIGQEAKGIFIDEGIIKNRNRIIKILKQITSGNKSNNCYTRCVLLGQEVYFVLPCREINKIRQTYDYIIPLNKTTINGLDRGILFGKPVKLKDNVRSKMLVSKNQLDTIIDELNIKEINYKQLSNVFNGISTNSFVNQIFKQDFILPSTTQELEIGAFRNCICNGRFEAPTTILGQLTRGFSNLTKVKLCAGYFNRDKKEEFYVSGRFGIRVTKPARTNYIQYNDVFKIGEALRVYEDHLTLYRSGEAGQGFREYEYMNNFEYRKFYGDDPDDMIISILLAKYNVVTVAQVTVARIEIYNEMNN